MGARPPEQITTELADQILEHPMMAHRADSRGMLHRGRSADAAEGIAAFLEKRPADFPDRVSEGLPDVMPDRTAPEFG